MALCWRAPPRPLPLSRGCSLQPCGLYGCCLQPTEAHFQTRFLAQGAPPLLQTGALDHLSLRPPNLSRLVTPWATCAPLGTFCRLMAPPDPLPPSQASSIWMVGGHPSCEVGIYWLRGDQREDIIIFVRKVLVLEGHLTATRSHSSRRLTILLEYDDLMKHINDFKPMLFGRAHNTGVLLTGKATEELVQQATRLYEALRVRTVVVPWQQLSRAEALETSIEEQAKMTVRVGMLLEPGEISKVPRVLGVSSKQLDWPADIGRFASFVVIDGREKGAASSKGGEGGSERPSAVLETVSTQESNQYSHLAPPLPVWRLMPMHRTSDVFGIACFETQYGHGLAGFCMSETAPILDKAIDASRRSEERENNR
ncbi:unnamed protein product [Vitrella brassicaformis CCMP3155]|uniref:Uncharacterized protein n=1 Tax=Vitrella brassicaformis (strain CCMP3155) TaxID=1169540 RepID=A0A0G4GI11_VITBC|nr:unnamed protein product [Vitrella brassicaformis CCMP3155]|eukprot:CEM29387.1 unnamed protein product [Vitrella brassicaformis CCMP3155]